MFPEVLSPAGRLALAVLAVLSVGACQPTVKVQAPDKPIEINLNVRIDQEVRVKLDRDLEDLFSEKDEIF
ncbi:MAG: YnbE family lipoprotein [Inquilinaceae bacterium]